MLKTLLQMNAVFGSNQRSARCVQVKEQIWREYIDRSWRLRQKAIIHRRHCWDVICWYCAQRRVDASLCFCAL